MSADSLQATPATETKGVLVAPRLSHLAIKGAGWLGLQFAATRGAQMLGQLVLAWLLTPEDFGEIGLAYTVFAFANLLANSGLDDVLMQRQNKLADWVPAAFWMTLSAGALGMILMIVAAPIAARLYHEPDLTRLIMVLAATIPVSSLSVLPITLLRVSLRFRSLALIGSVESLCQQGLAVLFAYKGLGAYSFVLPALAIALVKSIGLWLYIKPTVCGALRLQQCRSLFGDGAAILGVRLLTIAVLQGDYVVLGLTASSVIVGTYYFAFSIAAQIRTLSAYLTNVMFPTLMMLSSAPARQSEATLRACKLVSLVVIPLCFLQAALAGPFLHLFFGQKWNGAILLVQVLSVGLAFDMQGSVVMALLQARGEFKRILKYSWRNNMFFFGGVILGSHLASAFGVAISVALFYAIFGPLFAYLALRTEGISLWRVLSIYGNSVGVSAVSIGCAMGLATIIPLFNNHIAYILFVVAISAMFYIPLSYRLNPDGVRTLIYFVMPARGAFRHG